ncbi:MAG: ATP-binding cassette domain-containing protein [Treponema sp.]|nr:ATP-binding cassette domain-containing protein [Treponema sp.]
MDDDIIDVENLRMDYRIARRDGGFLKYILSRDYTVVQALKGVSFRISGGSLVGFVGPNGAGKSTAIKILCGILAPASGRVSVMGNDPFAKRRKNAAHIGVVFGQRSQLWWDLPIGDTFTLLKKIYKVKDADYTKNLDLFNNYLDLKSIWNQPVRQLSLGQRMRAEIAAAILHNPALLFLDEPTIGLDIVAKRQIREFVLTLNREYKTTVILTSHDLKDIEEICGRIILIDEGSIVVDCPTMELKDTYNKTSVVNVLFSNPFAGFTMAGVTGRPDLRGLKWSFEINKAVTSTGHFIAEITKVVEPKEIEIKERSVEDIVHDIMKK